MICPRDCFFCLKRILIFIYNIYNTYYKNIYIIYSIYTSVILGQDTQLVMHGDVDWERIVVTYMGLPVFFGFYLYHKLRYRTHLIPLEEVDLGDEEDEDDGDE